MAEEFVRFKARGAFAALIRKLPAEWQAAVNSLLESVVFRNELEDYVSGSSDLVDHGTLAGLADDDHSLYHTDGRAATWLATKDITDLGTYDHTSLTTIGTNTHAQIDTHIAATNNPHSTNHGALGGLTADDHPQYLLADGTRGLSAAWDAGSYNIQAETFTSDIAVGTAPFTVTSTTVVTNLNADTVDGYDAADIDYDFVSGNDSDTDVDGLELEELTDGSTTNLHEHSSSGGIQDFYMQGEETGVSDNTATTFVTLTMPTGPSSLGARVSIVGSTSDGTDIGVVVIDGWVMAVMDSAGSLTTEWVEEFNDDKATGGATFGTNAISLSASGGDISVQATLDCDLNQDWSIKWIVLLSTGEAVPTPPASSTYTEDFSGYSDEDPLSGTDWYTWNTGGSMDLRAIDGDIDGVCMSTYGASGYQTAHALWKEPGTCKNLDINFETYVTLATVSGGISFRDSTVDGTPGSIYYVLRWGQGIPGDFELLKRAKGDGSAVQLATASGFTLSLTTAYTIRVLCYNNLIKCKIWASAGAEPSSWQIEESNSEIPVAGGITFFGYTNSGGDPEIDNLDLDILD